MLKHVLRQHQRASGTISERTGVPLSVTVDGLRRTLASLCEGADYQFDEPLKPHGARRIFGDQLYQEQTELAQDALRHQSIETTHKAYSEERVRRIKERGDELLE